MDSAARAESMLHSEGGGLYIHIPFCRGKCIYCDFYSVGDRIADWHAFVSALISELDVRIEELPKPLKTIYIGGGTPSLMPDKEFLRLCDYLHPLAGSVTEFTIEVNPDDVTYEKLNTWKRGGVDRLSMGVQSFNDEVLKAIRRRHSAGKARSAFIMANEVFNNISIDLIFGTPGQTLDIWRRDIDEAVALLPAHISSYSLMYEPKTALTLLRDKGQIKEAPEGLTEEMMHTLISTLRAAGYDHYEISNFALPGYRSIHNSSYWHKIPYLGLGPSAHSYDGHRCRRANRSDVRGYIDYWNGNTKDTHGDDLPIDSEYLSNEELREEFVMTSLRTREGIYLPDFNKLFGEHETDKLLKRSKRWIENNHLLISDKRLSLTEDAILMSDTVILDLI